MIFIFSEITDRKMTYQLLCIRYFVDTNLYIML